MSSERILVRHLWDRRNGIEKDYSIPSETTFLRRKIQHGRIVETDVVGGDIAS